MNLDPSQVHLVILLGVFAIAAVAAVVILKHSAAPAPTPAATSHTSDSSHSDIDEPHVAAAKLVDAAAVAAKTSADLAKPDAPAHVQEASKSFADAARTMLGHAVEHAKDSVEHLVGGGGERPNVSIKLD